MKKICIGVCCFNEEKNIEAMYKAITKEMQKLPEYSYDILFEDNCSTDDSQNILRTLAKKDKHVKVIFNQTNFGIYRSSTNNLTNQTGDAFISLPCDFQEPPEMIPDFIHFWEAGYDIVWAKKEKSKESKFKFLCRTIYYKIINIFSDHKQLEHVTTFGLMDRKVINTILPTKLQDPELSVRHLVMEYGFNIKLLPYVQQKRHYGKSSFTFSSYLSFAITSLCVTSTKPLRIMTIVGVIASFGSFLVALIYFIYKLLHWTSFQTGIAPMIIGLFCISSIQLFCLGILGEYLTLLMRKMTNQTLVVESERLNFEENDKDTVKK